MYAIRSYYVVSRYLKRHSYRIVANDLEPYAEVINRCYLANREELDLKDLKDRWEGLRASLAEGPLEGLKRKVLGWTVFFV